MRPEESGLMMDDWWKEHRMSDKKYFILSDTPKSYRPDQVYMKNVVRGSDYSPRRKKIPLTTILITCLLALVFGIFIWIGSGMR